MMLDPMIGLVIFLRVKYVIIVFAQLVGLVNIGPYELTSCIPEGCIFVSAIFT